MLDVVKRHILDNKDKSLDEIIASVYDNLKCRVLPGAVMKVLFEPFE